MSDQNHQKHSIKVPRLYKVAASFIFDYYQGKGSIKQLIYNNTKKHPNTKAIFSLCSQVVAKKLSLDDMLSSTRILTLEAPLQENLARVLITELVWGKGVLKGESKPILTVNKYAEQLKLLVKSDEAKFKPHPRYVRINGLKADIDRTCQTLKRRGFSEVNCPASDYPAFLDLLSKLGKMEFVRDMHVDNLLVFASGSDFHDFDMYKDGRLVLQDKASCLTVAALNPPKGCKLLDACAAPGMKTIQAAAAINGVGCRLVAVERDFKRCKTLRSTIAKHGADFVQVLNADFLTLDPHSYSDIEAIVLDPSCSGSGIRQSGTDESHDRLSKLANLQSKMLKHALSFPKVKAVAYSTCSTQTMENEDVVLNVLSDPEIGAQFQLRKDVLPNWSRRGDANASQSERFIRADPKLDYCHGFFVAVIERIKK